MKSPKNWVEPYELELDWEIATWLSKLHTLNKEQNGYWVQGMSPVLILINMIKSMVRGHYTPRQLKIDIETFINTEQNPVYWGGERKTTWLTKEIKNEDQRNI
jgi:hypothetical protein